MAMRFTSFDSMHGTRIPAGDRRWTHPVFVTFAVQSAQLPNAATGRIAAFEAPALPSPQVIISQVGLNPAYRAVLFDLRTLGLDIETLDVPPGASIWSSIMRLHQLPADHSVYGQLQEGRCCCLVNGVQHEVAAPLPAQADFVQLLLVARPFCQGDARPPVPPIPQPVPRTAGASVSSGGGQPAGSDAQHAVRPFLTATLSLSADDSRFSVLGTIEGVTNRHRPPTWTDNNCLLDAIVNAAAPRDFIDGHVLEYPLIGLWTPQVLLSRTLPSSGLVTVACDLRALRLGISVFEFRDGLPVGRTTAAGGIIFGELAQLEREHLAFHFLLNGLEVSPDAVITAHTETITLLPIPSSRLASSSTEAASRWQHPERSGQRNTALQFTVFDTLHHFRVLPRTAQETTDELIARALSATQDLPHAVGFLLEHIVPGLPAPQLVLLSSALGGFVAPVAYSFQPISVCTVEVPKDATPFMVAYQCSSSCHALRTAHNQLARETAAIAGRQGILPPFRAGCILGHEAVILRGFHPEACRPRHRPSASQSGMPRFNEARSLNDSSNIEDLHLHEVMICCTRRAAIRMPLHACLSYADCRHRIRGANRYGPRSAVIWPFLKPALPDARPLAMVITSEAFEESSLWGILDLRRVASPPLRVLQFLCPPWSTLAFCLTFYIRNCRRFLQSIMSTSTVSSWETRSE